MRADSLGMLWSQNKKKPIQEPPWLPRRFPPGGRFSPCPLSSAGWGGCFCLPAETGQLCRFKGKSCYCFSGSQARKNKVAPCACPQTPAWQFLSGFCPAGQAPGHARLSLSSAPCPAPGAPAPSAGSELGQSQSTLAVTDTVRLRSSLEVLSPNTTKGETTP